MTQVDLLSVVGALFVLLLLCGGAAGYLVARHVRQLERRNGLLEGENKALWNSVWTVEGRRPVQIPAEPGQVILPERKPHAPVLRPTSFHQKLRALEAQSHRKAREVEDEIRKARETKPAEKVSGV